MMPVVLVLVLWCWVLVLGGQRGAGGASAVVLGSPGRGGRGQVRLGAAETRPSRRARRALRQPQRGSNDAVRCGCDRGERRSAVGGGRRRRGDREKKSTALSLDHPVLLRDPSASRRRCTSALIRPGAVTSRCVVWRPRGAEREGEKREEGAAARGGRSGGILGPACLSLSRSLRATATAPIATESAPASRIIHLPAEVVRTITPNRREGSRRATQASISPWPMS